MSNPLVVGIDMRSRDGGGFRGCYCLRPPETRFSNQISRDLVFLSHSLTALMMNFPDTQRLSPAV